jgi:ADP-L-glycero-D-manno-heptose 6-epimerase
MIVVTGGAGFIGSALVHALNRRGEENIIIVDRLGTGDKWKNLNGLKYTDVIHKDDFYEMLIEEELPEEIDVIFHLGACSSTTEKDADYLLFNNYVYSVELARYAADNGIRFIYASSAATYGDGSQGYNDDENALESLRPLNMYGYSKQMFDLWAKRNGLLDKIVGVKYFNVYGPNEYHKGDMRSVVHKAFGQIKETGKVKLFKSYKEEYPDGGQMRDFIYVKDAVEMTLFFMDNRDANGIFNVGTGEARTWNDLVKAIFDALGKPVEIEYIEMPQELRGKYQYFTEAKMNKIRQAGYDKPISSIEEGVADYVKNYLLGKEYLAW